MRVIQLQFARTKIAYHASLRLSCILEYYRSPVYYLLFKKISQKQGRYLRVIQLQFARTKIAYHASL